MLNDGLHLVRLVVHFSIRQQTNNTRNIFNCPPRSSKSMRVVLFILSNKQQTNKKTNNPKKYKAFLTATKSTSGNFHEMEWRHERQQSSATLYGNHLKVESIQEWVKAQYLSIRTGLETSWFFNILVTIFYCLIIYIWGTEVTFAGGSQRVFFQILCQLNPPPWPLEWSLGVGCVSALILARASHF